jgi:hypothetical protein
MWAIKPKANEMCGINHESEILLDHPNGTNILTPNAPYYNNDEYFENDLNENHDFDFDNNMKNLEISQFIYMVTSTPYLIQL